MGIESHISPGTDRNTGLPANLYSPCDTDLSHNSMCCAWQQKSSIYLNAESGVNCRSDGLCADVSGGNITRTACTDPTWQAPECIKLCSNGTQASEDVYITVCNDGSYCCNDNDVAKACCNTGQGVFIRNGEEVPHNAVSSTTSTSSSSTSTASASSSARSSNTNHTSNTGAIVGGVVGGVLGLIALAGLGFFLLKRHQRRALVRTGTRSDLPYNNQKNYMAEVDASSNQKIEAPGPAVMRPELPGPRQTPPRFEMEAAEAL